MTKQAHTPGAWIASRIDAVHTSDGVPIAWTNMHDPFPQTETGRANTNLIAAAPDLLAALCVAIESLQTEGARAYDPTNKLATAHIDRAVEAARAAIAKAEGRQ